MCIDVIVLLIYILVGVSVFMAGDWIMDRILEYVFHVNLDEYYSNLDEES